MTHRHAVVDHPPDGVPDTGCGCGSRERVRWYQAPGGDEHKPYCKPCLWLKLTGR